jgi:hypothetical protein
MRDNEKTRQGTSHKEKMAALFYFAEVVLSFVLQFDINL